MVIGIEEIKIKVIFQWKSCRLPYSSGFRFHCWYGPWIIRPATYLKIVHSALRTKTSDNPELKEHCWPRLMHYHQAKLHAVTTCYILSHTDHKHELRTTMRKRDFKKTSRLHLVAEERNKKYWLPTRLARNLKKGNKFGHVSLSVHLFPL